LYIFVKKM